MRFLNMHTNVNAWPREAHFFDADNKYRQGLASYNAMLPRRKPGQLGITHCRHDMKTISGLLAVR